LVWFSYSCAWFHVASVVVIWLYIVLVVFAYNGLRFHIALVVSYFSVLMLCHICCGVIYLFVVQYGVGCFRRLLYDVGCVVYI